MKKILPAILFFALSFSALASENKVTRVFSCNNDVGIEIENIGWVVVQESQVGEKRIDRALSIALSLLAMQSPVGYINPGDPIKWCGIADAKPITVIQATRQ